MNARLEILSAKQSPVGREIRWHRKQDKFALPYETRQLVELENKEDEFLKVQVGLIFEERAQTLLGSSSYEASPREVAEVSLLAIELTFQKKRLELAAFLTGEDRDTYGSISDQIDEAIQIRGIRGEEAIITKELLRGDSQAVLLFERRAGTPLFWKVWLGRILSCFPFKRNAHCGVFSEHVVPFFTLRWVGLACTRALREVFDRRKTL